MQPTSKSPDISKYLNERVINLADFAGTEQEQQDKLNSWRKELREKLNSAIYTEPGREWYQGAFIEYFAFMYDKSFYNRAEKRYLIYEMLNEGEREFGGYDFIILWQAYPRIGIDNRNQFDHYRDMPGGLDGLRKLADRAHERGVRVFINYNPWDTGTRREDKSDAEALAEIIQGIGADGIFLDTMSTADVEFRNTVENANPNIVFDPEGLPTPLESNFLTGSWRQTALPAPPELMTIRWLEPRYSLRGISRATDSREWIINVDFFCGSGQVVWENIFGWWNPWGGKDRTILKKCVKLLREHNDAFRDLDWQPYIKTLTKGVYANKWNAGEKTVYTLLNTNNDKSEGQILAVSEEEARKYYDVWSGNEIGIGRENGKCMLSLSLESRSAGCVVSLPPDVPAPEGANVQESLDTPYRCRVTVEALSPRPPVPSPPAKTDENIPGMVFAPGGRFVMDVHHNVHPAHEGSCYGSVNDHRDKYHPTQYYWLKPYFMDRAEVTNSEYKEFLEATHYCPSDITNFLKLWKRPDGKESSPWEWAYPEGKESHPVVYVDLDDARAYARWADKRLPREEEWQYAAQGSELLSWPWGNEFDPSLCNGDSDDTTPVDNYPEGASPFGCLDMSGNVWEWTESERDDGHTRYAIVRGGSYLVVKGSMWYTSVGAQACNTHEKLPLMYPGLDRCLNIGFRCVKDAAE